MTAVPLALAHPTSIAKSRPGRAPTVPVCAACGRRLRKARCALVEDGLNHVSREMAVDIAGRPWPPANPLTSDGAAPTRGDYGDNLVCGPRCGHALAVRLVAAVPGILELLPEQWRHR